MDKKVKYLLLSSIFLLLTLFFHSQFFNNWNANKKLTRLQGRLWGLEETAQKIEEDFTSKELLSLEDFTDYYSKPYTLLFFEKGNLKYWSNRNFVPQEIIARIGSNEAYIIPYNEKSYFVKVKQFSEDSGLYFIHPISEDRFCYSTSVFAPQKVIKISASGKGQKTLFNAEGTEMGNAEVTSPRITTFYIEITWILHIIFLVIAIFLYSLNLPRTIWGINRALLLLIILLAVKFLVKQDPFNVISNIKLFQPVLYANAFIGQSLGILLINLLVIALSLFNWYLKPTKFLIIRKFPKTGKILFVAILLSISYFLLSYTIRSIIIDSSQRFSFEPFRSVYSFSAFLVLFLSVVFYLLVNLRFVKYCERKFTLKETLILFLFHVLISIILFSIAFPISEIAFQVIWQVITLTLFFLLTQNKDKRIKHVSGFVLFIVLAALLCAQNLKRYNNVKSNNDILQTARKLSLDEDNYAEFLIDDVSKKILQDDVITKLLNNPFLTEETLIRRIESKYITQRLSIYNIDYSFATISEEDSISVASVPESRSNYNEFIYNVKLPFTDIPNPTMITLNFSRPKVESSLEPYSATSQYSVYDFSYAVYKNGDLRYLNGNVQEFKPNDFSKLGIGKEQIKRGNGFTNLMFKKNDDTMILVSVAEPQINNNLFFLFTNFFVGLFSAFIVFVLVITRFKLTNARFFKNSLANQIQFLVLAILFLTGLIVTIISMQVSKSELYKVEQISYEGLLSTLLDEFTEENGIDDVSIDSLVTYLGENYKNASFDLSFYNQDGELEYTNNRKPFVDNTWPMLVNPYAWQELINKPIQTFKVRESIDGYKYVGFYNALRDSKLSMKGILYLPAIQLKNEVEQQRDLIVQSQFNTFSIVLFTLTFVSLLITQSLTGILLKLRQSFSQVQIGEQQKLIEWNTDDEIGAVVKEYNQMVKKLDESAVLLARSERESAWRDLAKQVAHEIKNPLTPMKLSIQHLKHRVKNDAKTELDETVLKTLTSLENQMQHLANIADNFSSVSRMQLPEFSKVNLLDAVLQVLPMYSTNENFELKFVNQLETKEAFVKADRTMLSRVLNNLLKNAQQALLPTRRGNITVILKEEDEIYKIIVTDNGKGIAMKDRAKIFTPNFTTKSSGTGIGLMMSKKIMQMHRGDISFQSEEGAGTTFWVVLPKSWPDENN